MTFLFGVNIAGAEFGQALNTNHGHNYIHPPIAMINDFANEGCKVIRYPIKWERIQEGNNVALRQAEVDLLTARVTEITNAGMVCLIDIHNYMRKRTPAIAEKGWKIGETNVGYGEFADLWSRLADLFKTNELVWFNLMNEPYGVTQEQIYQAQQAAIDSIRATGSTNKILVSIDTWSSARVSYNAANMETLQLYNDPANNIAVDLHQYFDNGLAGTGPSVINHATAMGYITNTTVALRSIGWQAFLGEFNAGEHGNESQAAMDLLEDITHHMVDNQDVWLGATLWAAGPWWGSYYFLETPTSTRFTTLRDIADAPQQSFDWGTAIFNFDASVTTSIVEDINNAVESFASLTGSFVALPVGTNPVPDTGAVVNGLNALSFDQTNNDRLSFGNLPTASNLTVFLVFEPVDESSYFVPLAAGASTNSSRFLLRAVSGNSDTALNGNSGTLSYRLDGVPASWSNRGDVFTALNNRVNVLTIEGVDFTAWNDINIGNHCGFGGNNWSYNGKFCQAVVFENLSTTDRDLVETLLLDKWK